MIIQCIALNGFKLLNWASQRKPCKTVQKLGISVAFILCVYNHECICKRIVESIYQNFYLYGQKSVLLKIALLHTAWIVFTSLMVQKGHKFGTFQLYFEKQRKFKAQQFQSCSDDQVKCEDVLSDFFSHWNVTSIDVNEILKKTVVGKTIVLQKILMKEKLWSQ